MFVKYFCYISQKTIENINKENFYIYDWDIENMVENEKLMLFNDKKYAFDKMCSSDTKNVNNLYDMVCYLNYTINEEFKTFISRQSKKFIINIKEFSEEFKNNLNKAVESWSQMASLVITKI